MPQILREQNIIYIQICAQDDEERSRIEAEMAGAPETERILELLHATRATARERQSAMERSIREEARRLRQEQGGGGPVLIFFFSLFLSCLFFV